MSRQTIVVPRLPGFNELLRWRGAKGRRGKKKGAQQNYYNLAKERFEDELCWVFMAAKLQPFGPAEFFFVWQIHKNLDQRLPDPDNLSGGGRKILFDALVKGGYMPHDRWSQTGAGWCDRFEQIPLDQEEGVIITITETSDD